MISAVEHWVRSRPDGVQIQETIEAFHKMVAMSAVEGDEFDSASVQYVLNWLAAASILPLDALLNSGGSYGDIGSNRAVE